MTWLFVGLGNPGDKYRFTRHNVGFMAIDFVMAAFQAPATKTEMKAHTSKVLWRGETLIFAKPQTFMNLSGESVQPLCHYYKVTPDKLVVLHDDVDLEFAQLKLQKGRGHGGQNGIRNIHLKLATSDYLRVRLGVGRSANSHISTADHVLQNFNEDEMRDLPTVFDKVTEGLEVLVGDGFEKAATFINSKET